MRFSENFKQFFANRNRFLLVADHFAALISCFIRIKSGVAAGAKEAYICSSHADGLKLEHLLDPKPIFHKRPSLLRMELERKGLPKLSRLDRCIFRFHQNGSNIPRSLRVDQRLVLFFYRQIINVADHGRGLNQHSDNRKSPESQMPGVDSPLHQLIELFHVRKSVQGR